MNPTRGGRDNKITELLKSIKNRVCIAEVGTGGGGSADPLTDNYDGEVYLFDTFEGLPHEDPQDNYHHSGEMKFSEEIVREKYKDKKNVIITKGVFPQTASVVADKLFLFVHLDVDMYRSYKECLEFFYPRMIPGGIIVFDDYGAPTCLGAKIAIDEFFVGKPEVIMDGASDSQKYVQIEIK